MRRRSFSARHGARDGRADARVGDQPGDPGFRRRARCARDQPGRRRSTRNDSRTRRPEHSAAG
jgi:hypothetical protein